MELADDKLLPNSALFQANSTIVPWDDYLQATAVVPLLSQCQSCSDEVKVTCLSRLPAVLAVAACQAGR